MSEIVPPTTNTVVEDAMSRLVDYGVQYEMVTSEEVLAVKNVIRAQLAAVERHFPRP